MKIGNLEIEGFASLAPMAGVADRAFREICMDFGAAMCTGEMVSAKGVTYHDRKSRQLMELSEKERPAGIQLFGSNPEDFAQAVPQAMEFSPDFIDINMGCPAPKVTKSGAGSALMREPERCGRIVRAVRDCTDLPVTVKIRSGWDSEHINAVETAAICTEAGAACVTVHGRTREQMYAPAVNLDIIRQVRECSCVPVIGNGDVTDAASAKKMYEQTGCNLVAVGRGALGRPWIFAEINAAMRGEAYREPDIREKMEIMLYHAGLICRYKGDRTGVREARKHAVWYTKGLRGGAKYRRELSLIESLAQLEEISRRILAENE